MAHLWKVLVVLALGLTVHVPTPQTTSGYGFDFGGPGIAIFLYGILALVTLTSVLNHLPGALALRRPLGTIPSGYEYLWLPAIVANLFGFKWTGVIEGRDLDSRYWTIVYGSGDESYLPVTALVVFVVVVEKMGGATILSSSPSSFET